MALAINNTTSETQVQKTYRVLSNGDLCLIPDGADADFVVKVKEAALKAKAAGRRTSRRSSHRASGRKCNHSASDVLGRAMVETVERVNHPEDDTITVNGYEMARAEFFGEVF